MKRFIITAELLSDAEEDCLEFVEREVAEKIEEIGLSVASCKVIEVQA